MYFIWPSLEAGLSISTFSFLPRRCFWSAGIRKNYRTSRIGKHNF